MATLTIEPISEDDEDLLQQIDREQREFYMSLNEQRWEDFNNQEKVFEKTLEDVPESPLPETTEEILLKANAKDWASHILQAVKTAHISRMRSSDIISSENLWFDKTELASPIGRFPTFCLYSTELEYNDNQLRVQTELGELKTNIIDGKENISALKNTPLYIYETSAGYALEPYNIISEPKPSLPREETPETDENEDYRAVLRTLSVAASVTAATQVEPHTDNEAFPKLFDEIGLYWKKVKDTSDEKFDTYLIGTQKRGKERIEQFLNTEKSDRTISQYCKLLGIPQSVGEYYCTEEWQQQDFDRYSAEEFALYGIMSGDIKEENAKYLLYTPYRPPPEIKEIQYAIQLAKQFQEGLNILYNEAPTKSDYEQLMSYYDQHNTQRALLKDKPIIEVYNWLVDCEPTQKPTTTKS